MTARLKIRTLTRQLADIKINDRLNTEATRWNYILGNRNRWPYQDHSLPKVQKEATETLEKFFVSKSDLKKIAADGVLEISCPPEAIQGKSAASKMPWEHLFCAATKPYRENKPVVVLRHLNVNRKTAPRTPETFAFIESAPGKLFRANSFFRSEKELVCASLNTLKQVYAATDPTRASLAKRIKTTVPDIIHFAGIDTHLGSLLKNDYEREDYEYVDEIEEGVHLAHASRIDEKVPAKRFAEALMSGGTPPVIVSINTWHSGAQIAPHCLELGADFAFGFQSSFDQTVAEAFFSTLYYHMIDSNLDVLAASIHAFSSVMKYKQKLRGSIITLWSAQSVFSKRQPKTHIARNLDGVVELIEKTELEKFRPRIKCRMADPRLDEVHDLVGVKVTPRKKLNYSLLHNKHSILKELYLWFKAPKRLGDCNDDDTIIGIRDIEIDVKLMVGKDYFSFATRVNLTEDNAQIDIADRNLNASGDNPAGGIHIPLVAETARSVNEAMPTSIFVTVKWHGQTLYSHTHLVTLAPTDEWGFAEEEIWLLPSFIQSRDPAIVKIVDVAQKYLYCLEDDPKAGFRGYQAHDVDLQVKAIWAALVYDFRLDYVSPPTSHDKNAQRLRSPSQVLEQQRGTCIDLALLMTAILEWIEISPVMLTTTGHAFLGYWHKEIHQYEFIERMENVARENQEQQPESDSTSSGEGRRSFFDSKYPWVGKENAYPVVQEFVQAKKLVPLDAVGITEGSGFSKNYFWACDFFIEGTDTCVNPQLETESSFGVFEAIIDVRTARNFVTPLPYLSNPTE